MSFTFNPAEEHKIYKNTRLVIYDMERKCFHSTIIIKQGDTLILEDKMVTQNPWSFKYKYQIQRENQWHDVTKYIHLANDREIESFLLEKVNLDDDKVKNLTLDLTSNKSPFRLQSFNSTVPLLMRSLWKDTKSSHKNAEKFINSLKKQINYEPTFLGNVTFYLDNYLKIKNEMQQKGHHIQFYDSVFNNLNNDKNTYNYLEGLIDEYDKHSSSLQLANILSGKLLSFLGQRQEAIKRFNQALLFEDNHINTLKFDQGVYTYSDLNMHKNIENSIEFLYDQNHESETVILISLDTRFLRFYAVNLLFTISVLKNYHFHFHVIGERTDVEKCISETTSLFKTINKYRQSVSSIKHPTFSTEAIPKGIPEIKTFYACSRYLSASYFMDHFNSDIYIMDADLFLNDDLESYLKSLKQYDIALTFARGLATLCPWRRIGAGNLFLKNNSKSRKFISLVSHYITNNIYKPTTWTLDQNALTYAYEKICMVDQNINIGNICNHNRPTFQPPIRRQIEIL
ncbi:hypothetical protein EV581_11427 [Bacillus sp. BK006]|nr:hypothetical protein EV581_11427 [Bacillus sp. BK006]